MQHSKTFLAVLSSIVFTGCATTGLNMTDEEIVAKRAKERYDYVIDAKYEEAYGYLSPSYRSVRSYRQYLGTQGSAVTRVPAPSRVKSSESRTPSR